MSVNKTKQNFIGYLTLFTLVGGGMGAVVLHKALSGAYWGMYPLVPLYFYLLGLGSIYLFDTCRQRAPQRLLLVYLGMKVFKMILSVLLLLLYCVIAQEVSHVFLFTFIAFYLLFLVYETWFFFAFELKRTKKTKDGKKYE